jgi:hypothetical protein
MEPVVFDGVTMNLEPSPRRDLAALGTRWLGVKSWKAIFDGIVDTREVDIEDSRRRTALLKGVVEISGTKPKR